LHFYSAQSKVFSINFPSNINAVRHTMLKTR
jgi:hypothetical protein